MRGTVCGVPLNLFLGLLVILEVGDFHQDDGGEW